MSESKSIGFYPSGTRDIEIKFHYVEGLGTRVLKVGLFNRSEKAYCIEAGAKAAATQQVTTVLQWTWTKHFVGAGKKVGNWDSSDMEKHPDTWVDGLTISALVARPATTQEVSNGWCGG